MSGIVLIYCEQSAFSVVGFGVIFHFLLGSHLDCLNSLCWTHVTFRKNIKVIILKVILKRPVVEINRKK